VRTIPTVHIHVNITGRGGPSTFGALGELHSWRPPPPKRFLNDFALSNAILSCKTEFLSNKQNNDRNNEQTLNKEQNP